MASCATVMIVPFIIVIKVVNAARAVSVHFFEIDQLYGFSGSLSPSQDTTVILLAEAWYSINY